MQNLLNVVMIRTPLNGLINESMKKLMLIVLLYFLSMFHLCAQNSDELADSLRVFGNYKLELNYRHQSYNNNPKNPSRTYNLACCYALSGNIDSAFIYLNEAIRLGQDDGWALADQDLQSLHKEERWEELKNRLKNSYIEKNKCKNPELAWEIYTMFFEDQAPKAASDNIMKKYGIKSPQMDSVNRVIAITDSLNMITLEGIFSQYGWVTKELIGTDGMNKMFIIILHAPLNNQKKHFDMVKKATENGNLEKKSLAYLTDKILTKEGKKQVYGTQLKYSHEKKGYEFKPIEDEKNVNTRRKEVGLGPIETYAKDFGFEYRQK